MIPFWIVIIFSQSHACLLSLLVLKKMMSFDFTTVLIKSDYVEWATREAAKFPRYFGLGWIFVS